MLCALPASVCASLLCALVRARARPTESVRAAHPGELLNPGVGREGGEAASRIVLAVIDVVLLDSVIHHLAELVAESISDEDPRLPLSSNMVIGNWGHGCRASRTMSLIRSLRI